MSWSLPNFIVPPSAKNKSENSKDVVPRLAPSAASGTKAVVAVIVVAWKVPLVVNPVSAVWVKVISWSSPKLITAPSAKNKSENSNELVPNAAPSDASGTKAVVAVIVSELKLLKTLLVTIYVAYFGSRGFEKVKNIKN